MRKGKKKQGNWGRQKMVKRGLGRRPKTSASVHNYYLSTQVVQLETKGIAISQIIWVRFSTGRYSSLASPIYFATF
jgi:hypothetical protein